METRMSSRVVFTGFILCLFSLCGCATPYQPLGFRGGYSDLLLESDRFRVSFKGNGYTSADTVETYLLYRSAELAVQRGFDYFIITDSSGETSQSFSTLSGSTTTIQRYRTAVIIKLFKRSKPDLPGVYTAKELRNNLRAQLPNLSEEQADAISVKEPSGTVGQDH
jgi:hypothetical protein